MAALTIGFFKSIDLPPVLKPYVTSLQSILILAVVVPCVLPLRGVTVETRCSISASDVLSDIGSDCDWAEHCHLEPRCLRSPGEAR